MSIDPVIEQSPATGEKRETARWPIRLEVPGALGDEPADVTVHDISTDARSLISTSFDFRHHHINYAKLSIRIKKVGKERARTIAVILRDDNKCNVKTKREKDRALCDRLLAKWNLVKEISDVAEEPVDALAA